MILTFNLTHTSLSLRPDNFCIKNGNNTCEGYDCYSKYCSINKISCEQLMIWKKAVLKKQTEKETNFKIKEMTKISFKNLIDSIKPCKKRMTYQQMTHRIFIGWIKIEIKILLNIF